MNSIKSSELKSNTGNNLHPFGYIRCNVFDCQRKAIYDGVCRHHYLKNKPCEWDGLSDNKLFNIVYSRYRIEFNQLINAAAEAYRGQYLSTYTKHGAAIYNLIKSIPNSPLLDKEDMKQHLMLQWFIYARKYRDNHPATMSMKYYLTKISVFALRDYIRQLQKISTRDKWSERSLSPDETLAKPPKITLAFVAYGSPHTPFRCLSSQERYLVYLRYAMDRSINEIALLLGHYKSSISNQLEEIKLKLRRQL